MKRFAAFLVFGLVFLPAARPAEVEPGVMRRLLKADVLPLALSEDFEFRKSSTLSLRVGRMPRTTDMMIAHQRSVRYYGAITPEDEADRRGDYFTFFWRTRRPADVAVRLEFRQANLGSYVQAREIAYANVKGSRKTEFAVIGEDFTNDGPVISWRALLIEDGKIVAVTQSSLWQ